MPREVSGYDASDLGGRAVPPLPRHRRYRDTVALDNVSFNIETGSITGLLAALTVVRLTGGYATMRRVTV
ncbi:MAG: hypothetical protein WBF34_28215 [Streptosporangiaceae bacterium]